MAGRLKIIVGFHCHFPLALKEADFGELYKQRLMPLLRTLNKHPACLVTIHFSGSLLYRIERKYPEFFAALSKLIDRKQVELLGGGFYEPMLPLAFPSDRMGQMELFNTYIRQHFDKRVIGCLIPPESWESDMVNLISAAGMRYTFLPEDYFPQSQIRNAAGLYQPFISEDKGRSLVIFPVLGRFDNQRLLTGASCELERILQAAPETAAPPAPVAAAVASSVAAAGVSPVAAAVSAPVAALFPDLEADLGDGKNAEKIFTAFFTLLEEYAGVADVPAGRPEGGRSPNGRFPSGRFSSGRIELVHPSQLITDTEALSKIYINGQNIKRYFTEYPESANLYSKTIWTKRIIEQIHGDKAKKQSASEELWKAQGYRLYCKTTLDETDVIVNPVMRSYAYQNILLAEKMAMGAMFTSKTVLSKDDFNFDGDVEYIFHGCKINAYIQRRGAFMFELDYVFKTWNYLSTFAARGENGAFRTRGAFMDSFCSGEDGFFGKSRDCSRENYTVTKYVRSRAKLAFELPALEGGAPFAAIASQKAYHVNENHIEVSWTLINKGDVKEQFYFISEINLSFPGDSDRVLRIFSSDTRFDGDEKNEKNEKKPARSNNVILKAIQALEFHDIANETLLRLTSGSPFTVRMYPVTAKITTSRTKQEHEYYQSTCVETSRYIELEAGARINFQYTLGIF